LGEFVISNKFEKGEIFVWMPLIGFDRDQPDKGVSKLIERMGFLPHGISVFMFHPDIVHLHDGLAEEKIFPPDNCSYYGSIQNEERHRQAWTNYDLKNLTDELNAAKVEPFLGIMGVDLHNVFRKEWLSNHPELKFHSRTHKWSLNVLKRFANGEYYEDFFADKICKVLTDYGFSGLHVTDNFCPSTGTLFCGDFSTDMLQQFAEHSGTVFPRKVTKGLLDDSFVYFLSVHFSGLGLNFFPKSRIESMLIIWLCHSIRTSR